MSKILVLVLLLISTIAMAADHFKIISISELDQLIQKKSKKIHLYDANVESTRDSVGIIPGAKLISSSDSFDLKKDLPTDKNEQLIFYCANTRCSASHIAAEKAISLGYKNVSVMTEGIYGWKKAGKKLQLSSKEASEVGPKEAFALVKDKKAIIVDVRENEERHITIEGAEWFPMSKAENAKDWSNFVAHIPQDKKIIFHCAAGFRSKKLAEKLSAAGNQASYFKGPDQWKEAGLSVKTNNP